MLLASEITNFLKGVITKKVKTYDPSNTRIILAETLILDGVVSMEISELVTSTADTGIDDQYYAVIEQSNGRILTVNLLPTATCITMLETLDRMAKKNKAFIRVNIIENGESVGAYSAHIQSLGSRTSSLDENVRSIVFGLREKRRKNQSNIVTVTEDERLPYTGNVQTFPLVD